MNALLLPPTDFICLGSEVCWLRLALVGPLPALGFLLQAVAVGTAIGAAVALRATRRHCHVDTWAITTAWASLALGVGAVVEIVSWLT